MNRIESFADSCSVTPCFQILFIEFILSAGRRNRSQHPG